MKLSIIIPVYNVEKYLPRCIESLLNQSLEQPYELIFVNDASPDESLAILKDYKKRYPEIIKVIDSPVNLKQGGARNLGIELAVGEYIGFVDSDDWVSTDMYNILYSEAKKSDYDIVDCDYCEAYGPDEIISYKTSNDDDQIGDLNIERKKTLILYTGRLWTKIFKREIFIKNNFRFVEHLFYEDNEIMPAIMVSAKSLGKVKGNLYYYFVDDDTSTTKRTNSYHHFDRLETSIRMLERFKEMGLYEKYQDEIEFRFFQLYYINTISISLSKFDKPELEYLEKIRDYMNTYYPNYRKNKYFENRVTLSSKVKSKLNDLSPSLLVWIFSIFQKVRR